MPEEMSIRVNFSKLIPVFPIDGVVMLPQQVMPLHIFEPRYRQMVSDALDAAGQIAMASFKGKSWKDDYQGRPPLKPAVCVGQIVQHESMPDGRYNILLQGVCRARIIDEPPPEDGILYRRAMLEPVGIESEPDPSIETLRDWLSNTLEDGPLSRLTVAEQVLEYVNNDEVPTTALLELVAFGLLTDTETRYRLLAEPDVNRRAAEIRKDLKSLESLIRRAMAQNPEQWPKGLSWN